MGAVTKQNICEVDSQAKWFACCNFNTPVILKTSPTPELKPTASDLLALTKALLMASFISLPIYGSPMGLPQNQGSEIIPRWSVPSLKMHFIHIFSFTPKLIYFQHYVEASRKFSLIRWNGQSWRDALPKANRIIWNEQMNRGACLKKLITAVINSKNYRHLNYLFNFSQITYNNFLAAL